MFKGQKCLVVGSGISGVGAITLLEKLQAASNPKQDESFSKVCVTDTYFPHYNQHKKIISPSCSSDDALHFLSRSDSGTGVHPGRHFLPL